jgi:hypothetical protein
MSMKLHIVWTAVWLMVLTVNAWADLTGRWSCDDGGTYYLRQDGRRLYWYAAPHGTEPAWATVFSGRIYGKRIKGRWADVPKGRATGSGDLELTIENDGTVLRSAKNDSRYRGSQWTRQDQQTRLQRPLERLQPSGKKECAQFDPSVIRVQQIRGRWQLVDGKHWLYDFGADQVAATKALEVIKHYGINRMCALGTLDRPHDYYLLARGGSPWGPMDGESCVAIDPDRAAVSRRQDRWIITSGKRRLFDFGKRQTDAKKALAVIRQHGFTHRCQVGRPDANFIYLRR